MPRPLLIFSQSDCLIWIVTINSNTKWQIVQIQISWLLLQKPTGLDLHCLQKPGISWFSRTRVKACSYLKWIPGQQNSLLLNNPLKQGYLWTTAKKINFWWESEFWNNNSGWKEYLPYGIRLHVFLHPSARHSSRYEECPHNCPT